MAYVFFRITIPAFLFTAKAAAQEVLKPRTTITQSGSLIKALKPAPTYIISGIVTDTTGSPVPFASVLLQNTSTGVQADENGKFQITPDANHSVLTVSAIGFETIQVSVDKNSKDVIVTMQPEQLTIPAVVISCNKSYLSFTTTMGAMVSRYTIRREVRREISKDPITIFPNPFPSNSNLTIRWKKPVNNNQGIEVFTFGGALVQTELIHISKAASESTVHIKVHAAGTYVLRVTDMKSNKVNAMQLVILN